MKKVSVYIKSGERNAASFYRFIQYLDNIKTISICYHKRLPDKMYKMIMPISRQPIIIKLIVALYMYLRVMNNLISDLFWKPDYIIISKGIMTRIMTPLCKYILTVLKKKGAIFIWDFDDHIIEFREISRKNFNFLSDLSSHIFTASPILSNLVDEQWRGKVLLLPTTDGQTYMHYSVQVKYNRLLSYDSCIRIAWVASSSSLEYLLKISEAFEIAGRRLFENKKKLELIVVCDLPLNYKSTHFLLSNYTWEREKAINIMLQSHIGIMPLANNESTRGKGGFKLIQYLGCALPIICSDVGINCEITSFDNGFLVHELDCEEWADAIVQLSLNKSLWDKCSINALKSYEDHFSYENNLDTWKKVLS